MPKGSDICFKEATVNAVILHLMGLISVTQHVRMLYWEANEMCFSFILHQLDYFFCIVTLSWFLLLLLRTGALVPGYQLDFSVS